MPRQQRSRDKVALMFEAAMQLLVEGDIASLTINAVAARAGVSIGTLYQYFDDKQALLDALTARELGVMSEKLLGTLHGAPPAHPGDRIRQMVRAVTDSYGGRTRVHQRLIEHALTQGSSSRLSPLYAQLLAVFTSQGVPMPDAGTQSLSPAQAFVLTHAAAGVLRALSAHEDAPPATQIEDALVQMLVGYLAGLRASHATQA